MLARAVAASSKANFFCVSAATLTSKFHGEGEKLVRELFRTARDMAPSVIFLDEIDSLLSARQSKEHDAVRRLKTEFLVQFDGIQSKEEAAAAAGTLCDTRPLVIGATNRPQDLDNAVLRRLDRHIFIPLPGAEARADLVRKQLQTSKNARHDLEGMRFDEIAAMTEGYSCSDIVSLCREASFGPLRELKDEDLIKVRVEDLRPIGMQDFEAALKVVRATVSEREREDWVGIRERYL